MSLHEEIKHSITVYSHSPSEHEFFRVSDLDEIISKILDAAVEQIKKDTSHLSICQHYFSAVEASINKLRPEK